MRTAAPGARRPERVEVGLDLLPAEQVLDAQVAGVAHRRTAAISSRTGGRTLSGTSAVSAARMTCG